MNIKSITISGIVASLIYFLLGWVFYGMLFKDIYPEPEGGANLGFIYAGGLFYALLLSTAVAGWANTTSAGSGLQIGAIIGLFTGLSMNLYMSASAGSCDWANVATDTGITVVMSAIAGAVVAILHGRLSK